jgi:hypothetical protein
MRKNLNWLAAGILVAWCCAAAPSPGGEVPRDFSQQYGPATRKIQQFYTHAVATGTIVREYPLEERKQELTYEYRADGMNFRLDVSTRSWRRGIEERGNKESYLATPTASFHGWGAAKAMPIDDSKELSYSETKARIEKIFPYNQPFGFATDGTVLDLLRSPGILVAGIAKTKYEGREMVKVRFGEGADVRNRSPEEHSYVLLSPAEAWAVRGYCKVVGRGANQMIYRGTVSYGGMREGVPIADRIETWQEKGPSRTCVAHEVVNISRVTTGDPSWVTFTADGFPGPP